MTEDERLAGELAYLNKRADALDRELEKLSWDADVLQGAIDQEDSAKALAALVKHRGTVFDRMAAAHGEREEVTARIAAIDREQDQGKRQEQDQGSAAAARERDAAIAKMSPEAFPRDEPYPGPSADLMSWLDEPAKRSDPAPEPESERKDRADDPLDWMRNPDEPEREPEPEMDPERGGGR